MKKKLFTVSYITILVIFLSSLIFYKYCFSLIAGIVLAIIFALITYFFIKKIIDEKEDRINEALRMCRDRIQGVERHGKIDEDYVPFVKLIEYQKSALDLKMSEVRDMARERSEFTANATHELKTPLVSIKGYAELIETGMAREEDIRKFAKIIHDQGDHLLVLINEMLELSRIEAGSEPKDWEEIRLSKVMEEAFNRVRYQADSQNIFLSYVGDATIMGVPKLIFEMFFNIVENSVKYGKKGGLTEVIIEDCDGEIRVSVRDNGIGIPKGEHRRIFERFYRVDKSHSKKIEGTGLGLSIVKHIAELHSAEIGLESTLGKGTTITIYFPKICSI